MHIPPATGITNLSTSIYDLMRLLRWNYVCSTFYRAIGAALSPNDTRSEKQIPKFVVIPILGGYLGSSKVEYEKNVVELNLSNRDWCSTSGGFRTPSRTSTKWACPLIIEISWDPLTLSLTGKIQSERDSGLRHLPWPTHSLSIFEHKLWIDLISRVLHYSMTADFDSVMEWNSFPYT